MIVELFSRRIFIIHQNIILSFQNIKVFESPKKCQNFPKNLSEIYRKFPITPSTHLQYPYLIPFTHSQNPKTWIYIEFRIQFSQKFIFDCIYTFISHTLHVLLYWEYQQCTVPSKFYRYPVILLLLLVNFCNIPRVTFWLLNLTFHYTDIPNGLRTANKKSIYYIIYYP